MRVALILLSLILFISCNNKPQQKQTQEQKQEQILIGKISISDLQKEPYKQWFEAEYNSYKLDKQTLDSIKNRDFNMTIVLGTWCPDSRREVPRMIKILQYLGVPEQNITLICVDRHKQAKDIDIQQLNIQRIPTFIVYQNSQEKGRIVEKPQMSLEMDLKQILQQ